MDVCPGGHGLWLDAGEINLFIENYSKFRTKSPRNGAVTVATETAACPRCGVQMASELLANVPYLSCTHCNEAVEKSVCKWISFLSDPHSPSTNRLFPRSSDSGDEFG